MAEKAARGATQRDSAALGLIERLYRAALDDTHWNPFAVELSEAAGGPAITLAIRRPERPGWRYFGGAHELATLVAEDMESALVRAARRVDGFRGGFVSLGDAFPRVVLERNPWFQKWLAPHGIPPTWPLCHAVTVDRSVRCWVLVQPPARGSFDLQGVVSLGQQLVPHFRRAFTLHNDLAVRNHKQRALEEVLDRLAAGVILIGAKRRVIHANLSAQRMLALEDGLSLDGDALRGDPDHDPVLQQEIDVAIEAASAGDFFHVSRVTIPTRSGRRPFLVSLTPLLGSLPGSSVHEAVVVAFIASPDAISTASVQALEAIYGLTGAEAAVVRGLVEGRSIDEIANERGVKTDTARSQLKQVFAKTRTSRQPELIRLVLTSVSPLGHSPVPPRERSP